MTRICIWSNPKRHDFGAAPRGDWFSAAKTYILTRRRAAPIRRARRAAPRGAAVRGASRRIWIFYKNSAAKTRRRSAARRRAHAWSCSLTYCEKLINIFVPKF